MKVVVILKQIFIPHDENDFKPHLFREVGVSLLLFVSVFLLGSSAGSSFFMHKTVLGAEIAASVLIDLTNESRLAYNQSPLLRNEKLDQAAELKGQDMASKEYFSHNSPEGVTPWHWFKEAGYNFLYAGENLAINFTDSTDVEKAWLESPTHRANIMNVEFREIGMATVKGVYKNYPTIYIVQMFGTPAYGQTVLTTEDVVAPQKKIVIEKKATSTTDIATTTQTTQTTPVQKVATTSTNLAGNVKGIETGTVSVASSSASTTPVSNLEKIVSTQEMAVVKNVTATSLQSQPNSKLTWYSTWYEKVLFRFPHFIDYIYKGLLLVVAFSLVTMVLVEIRKQHYIHILYGISLLLLLTAFIYINQSFF